MTARPAVIVVGGGIAGLVAARDLAANAAVTLIDAAAVLGGKVASTTFRGRPLDRAPDAFITRNPSAFELCHALGLGEELITPSAATAAIWSRGRLRPFPAGLAIGIPTDPIALLRSGIVSPLAAARSALDALLPGRVPSSLVDDARAGAADPTVGALVGRRLGRAVVDALVDPLIGGINAGDVDALSFVAALPQLAPLIAGRRRVARALRPAPPPVVRPGKPGSIFAGLERGLGSLADALEADLVRLGVTIRRDMAIDSLARSADGKWRIAGALADGIVLATPADAAARILEGIEPELATELRAIPYAGVATVTLAWNDRDVPPSTGAALAAIARRRDRPSGPNGPRAPSEGSAAVLPGSGVLVPRGRGHLITAATFTSTKWPRSANRGEVVVRASAGRYGDDRALALEPDALVDAVRSDLTTILGITALPLEVHVERWPASFPQYIPGHLARVGRIRVLTERLGAIALCGAAYDGIGIPACIEGGHLAAATVTETLAR